MTKVLKFVGALMLIAQVLGLCILYPLATIKVAMGMTVMVLLAAWLVVGAWLVTK